MSEATSKTDTTNGSTNGAANGAGAPPAPPAPTGATPSTSTAAQPQPPSVVQPAEPMRLRVKVWTDPATKKRYLMPTAMLDPKKGMMTAYAMTDDDTKIIKLTPAEWNALPFHYFKEDGPAPRASTRVPDLVAR